MPLIGTFDTMQLSDVVQWLNGSGADGTLTISVDTDETYVVFENGNIMAVGSKDSLKLDLGQQMVVSGLIEERQLQLAITKAGGARTIVDVLGEEGAVTPADLDTALREYAFEMILDLFYQSEGSFHFSTESQNESLLATEEKMQINDLVHPISSQSILIEAMRRIDEWNRIREVFPSNYSVVMAEGEDVDDRVWREVKEYGAPVAVGTLCLRLGGSRFAVFKALFDLRNRGLISLDDMEEGRGKGGSLGPVDVLVENAELLIEEKQFDEAREVLATAANLDPENKEARGLLRVLKKTQLEYLYLQVPPFKVPVLAVSREDLKGFGFTPREHYLASRLNGKWDVGTLVVATPLGELETLRILRKLLHAHVAILR